RAGTSSTAGSRAPTSRRRRGALGAGATTGAVTCDGAARSGRTAGASWAVRRATPWRRETDITGEKSSHTGDELVDPIIDGPERILAQDRTLGLVVELEMDPVDREVAALLLGPLDELAA